MQLPLLSYEVSESIAILLGRMRRAHGELVYQRRSKMGLAMVHTSSVVRAVGKRKKKFGAAGRHRSPFEELPLA